MSDQVIRVSCSNCGWYAVVRMKVHEMEVHEAVSKHNCVKCMAKGTLKFEEQFDSQDSGVAFDYTNFTAPLDRDKERMDRTSVPMSEGVMCPMRMGEPCMFADCQWWHTEGATEGCAIHFMGGKR